VGAPAGTVKSRLQRGRRLLEEQLAALASSPAVLDSTLSGLEDWARDLRQRVLPDQSPASSSVRL
jgi:RNA polymerase sigma-70 factor (ECF subfamily)